MDTRDYNNLPIRNKTSIFGRLWYIAMLFLVTSIPPGIIFITLWYFWLRKDADLAFILTIFLNGMLMIYELAFFFTGLMYIIRTDHVDFGAVISQIDAENKAYVEWRAKQCWCRIYYW